MYVVDLAMAKLGEYPLPDRRAEVLFNVGRRLGEYRAPASDWEIWVVKPSPAELTARAQQSAIGLLERAQSELAGVAPEINPQLRLRIGHHLSLLESAGMVGAWVRRGEPEAGLVERIAGRLRQAAALYEAQGDCEIDSRKIGWHQSSAGSGQAKRRPGSGQA